MPRQHRGTTKSIEDNDSRSRPLGNKRGLGSSWAEVKSPGVNSSFQYMSQHQQQTGDCEQSELAKQNGTDHKCVHRDCPRMLSAQRVGNAHGAAAQCCGKAELACYVLVTPKASRKGFTAG